MDTRGSRSRRRRLWALVVSAAILLPACAGRVVTKTGRESANLYNVVLVMATIVFVVVELAIIYQAVKYRRRRGRESEGLPPQIHGNTQIEIVWTALPSIVIAILFVLSMIVYRNINKEPPADLNVQVTAFQWQWRFDYLDDTSKPMVTLADKGQYEGPTLVLPTGRNVHFTLISGDGTNDVIHSFYIPAFFFKRDVVPGRTNTFDDYIEPGTEGTYIGECAEFCGDFHNAMNFDVQILSGPDFDQWLEKTAKEQAKGPTCSPEGATVEVSAKDLKFDTDCLAASANQPFEIVFHNDDPNIPHNVDVYDKQGGTHLFGGTSAADTITGVASTTYKVPPQKAGSYYFVCDVHPTAMFGTFIVKKSGG